MPGPAVDGARRVLVVHGLWMTGIETLVLRQRLRSQGFQPQLFRYSSRRETVEALLARLAREAAATGDPFHALGHSLGGVLLLRLFERNPDLPLRRCVLLGAPVCGSGAARDLAGVGIGRAMLGGVGSAELACRRPAVWPRDAQLGVIAGTLSVGLGRFIADLPVPNDGAVAVAETAIEGAADRIELRVSHTGMLVSAAVARQTAHFLHTGHFAHRD